MQGVPRHEATHNLVRETTGDPTLDLIAFMLAQMFAEAEAAEECTAHEARMQIQEFISRGALNRLRRNRLISW